MGYDFDMYALLNIIQNNLNRIEFLSQSRLMCSFDGKNPTYATPSMYV